MARFLRPSQSNWFETYVPRDETVFALEALADTGSVQLELDPRLTEPLDLKTVRSSIGEFLSLTRRYSDYLPAVRTPQSGLVDASEQALEAALNRLREWSGRLDTLLNRRRELERERDNLLLLGECLIALHTSASGLAFLARPSRFLYKGVFACPRDCLLTVELEQAIDQLVPGTRHNFFVVAGLPDSGEMIANAYRYTACGKLDIPGWLPAEPDRQHPRVNRRIRAIERQIARIVHRLAVLRNDRAVAAALTSISLLQWYVERADDLAAEQKLCHVTGWTTAEDTAHLQQALERANVHAVIRFAHPPIFSEPPVNMLQAWWARPFQLFVDMLGTPGRSEIDPTGLLPFIVSILFGYMFPDVGHGLLLALFAALMYRRWPEGRFLIPCGLSAAVFGVVFGEVFGLEGVLEPLWIKPLEHPLQVLGVPLLFGVGLMLLGLTFTGVEAYWRNEARAWLQRDAAVLVIYAAVLAGLCCMGAYWAAAAALVWFLAGQLIGADGQRLKRLLDGIGHLLQSVFELALNTFSFLRVGAFALAHAGLSTAILGLASNIDNLAARIVFLVAGHALIVAIEGLVVFVQTTRLVLFEFFIRFLHADGRVFRPLAQPPGHTPSHQARTPFGVRPLGRP